MHNTVNIIHGLLLTISSIIVYACFLCINAEKYNSMMKKIVENNGKSGIENIDFFRFAKTNFNLDE